MYFDVYTFVREGRLHTTLYKRDLYKREHGYPYHIHRFPMHDTTSPQTQLNGVLMNEWSTACGSCKDLTNAVACCHMRNTWGWGRRYPPLDGGSAKWRG